MTDGPPTIAELEEQQRTGHLRGPTLAELENRQRADWQRGQRNLRRPTDDPSEN